MTNPPEKPSDTSFTIIYESLIEELDLEEDTYVKSLADSVIQIRNKFLKHWSNLIDIYKGSVDQTADKRTTRSSYIMKRKEITSQVYNYLKQYTVTGNLFGTLVAGTQSIKATKSLANDTGTVRLGARINATVRRNS